MIDSGKRIEIVRKVGRSLGSVACAPFDQSMYSVESSRPQKSRSWASLLNFGIFFRVELIAAPLLRRHVSERNGSNQLPSNRESNKQQPSGIASSQCVVPRFSSRVARIAAHQHRPVQKNFFALPEGNSVFLPILLEISFIPVEARALGKRVSSHAAPQRIYPAYTFRQCRVVG